MKPVWLLSRIGVKFDVDVELVTGGRVCGVGSSVDALDSAVGLGSGVEVGSSVDVGSGGRCSSQVDVGKGSGEGRGSVEVVSGLGSGVCVTTRVVTGAGDSTVLVGVGVSIEVSGVRMGSTDVEVFEGAGSV